MLKKIFSKSITLYLLVVSIVIVSLSSVFYVNTNKKNYSDLELNMKLLKPMVEDDGIEAIRRFENSPLRATMIASDGTVLYDTHYDALKMDNHSLRPEVLDASKYSEGRSSRHSDTIDEKTYYIADKLDSGDILRLSTKDKSILSIVTDMLGVTIFLVFITISLVVLFSIKLTKVLSESVNQIDVENPLKMNYYNELSPLITSLVKQKSRVSDKINSLRKKREELRAITENMNEIFIIIDSNTNIVSFNKAAQRVFKSINNIELQSVFVLDRSTEFINSIQDALIGKKVSKTFEFEGIYYQLIVNPIYDDDAISGSVLFMQDISERYSRDMLRREFSSNVSHELKTPLTSILGIAEIMKDGIVKPEDVSEFSGKIYKEANRLLALVNDIIKISRMDDNNSDFVKSDISLNTIIYEVYDVLEYVRDKKNVKMHMDLQEVRIFAVRQLIFEMIFNLCDNAIKYNVDNGDVFVTLTEDENEVILSIRDTGIGIEKANRDRVFERFYCVDNSRSKLHGGTGLGLSIVKHVAELHEADIILDSEIEVGTTINIIWHKS